MPFSEESAWAFNDLVKDGEVMGVTQVQAWTKELECVIELVGKRFSRSEVRGRTCDYLRGVERKNGSQLAEFTDVRW
jgi:hypothetical protein